MNLLNEIIKFTKMNILPSVSMDGGDLRVLRLEGDTVIFGAYAECAVCPACNEDYMWWLKNRLDSHFGMDFQIKIEKYPAYFGQ